MYLYQCARSIQARIRPIISSPSSSRRAPTMPLCLLLPFLAILIICAPNEFYYKGCVTAVDATTPAAPEINGTTERKIVKSLRSNVKLMEESSNKTPPSFLFPPDKATSTQHDRHMYSLIKDMKPLLQDDDTLLLLAHADPKVAAEHAINTIGYSVENRLTQLFTKAKTPECRAKVAQHYAYFISAIAKEKFLPFQSFPYELNNECHSERKFDVDNLPEGISIKDVQERIYNPPNPKFHDSVTATNLTNETISGDEIPEEDNETTQRYKHVIEYIDDPKELKLLYVVLTHDNPKGTIRLVDSLFEEGHAFVIHVDGKAEHVYQELRQHYKETSYVHFVPSSHRVRVNWGAFSMVNATLQALKYAFAIDPQQTYKHEPLDFHKVVHIASTSYPLKSNGEIRRRLSSYPLNANFFDVVLKPTNPGEGSWHYFVECDDAVHRIYRLTSLVSSDFETENTGVDLYTSSQWFISSRDYAYYLAEARPGTFVHKYLQYIEHVVVADEHFFGTVLRHVSPFCHAHHNNNFLHLQFDRWENEIQTEKRDERKCLMPHPDHCGRSPTTMTIDYLPILELCDDLFARKFDDEVDITIKDIIDINRARDEEEFRRLEAEGDSQQSNVSLVAEKKLDTTFEGEGILIVAKETLKDKEPLCLGLGPTKNKVKLTPCFYKEVLPSLVDGWETGAVIVEETEWHNRWDLGPCSSDGSLERMENGTLKMTPGKVSPTGPRCMLKQVDGVRAGRCLDFESERLQPGGEISVYPCMSRWHQFLSFGNGIQAPLGSMHMNIPTHIWKRIENSGREQEPYMCIGVKGRGNKDEEEWVEDKQPEEGVEHEYDDDYSQWAISGSSKSENGTGLSERILEKNAGNNTVIREAIPLSDWKDQQLITTRCSNLGGVIEFVVVPFIVEYNETIRSDNHTDDNGVEEDEL